MAPLVYGWFRASHQGPTLRATDLHDARVTFLNPFNNNTR